MTNQGTSPDHPMPVFHLDPARLGEVLMQLGAISSNLGHAGVYETVQSYWDRSTLETPEQRFVYDLLIEPAEQMADRWYGGNFGAARMALVINLMAAGRDNAY